MEKANKTCDGCNKIFPTEQAFERHQNRKNPCIINNITPEQEANPNRCIFCNKIFTNIGNRNKHLKICKIKANAFQNIEYNQKDTRINNLEKENRRLQKQLDQIKKNLIELIQNECVYFIAESPWTGRVKIGKTVDINKRLAQLQTGNANKLVIYSQINTKNSSELETQLHKELAEYRLVGEWFQLTEEQINEITRR
jgi:hypothetical protein